MINTAPSLTEELWRSLLRRGIEISGSFIPSDASLREPFQAICCLRRRHLIPRH